MAGFWILQVSSREEIVEWVKKAPFRDALLLVAWADLTYEETAAALGVPVGTVRSRVSRARSTMRAALGGVDPTSIDEEHNR